MEKIIWIIGVDKKVMIEAQRRINASGSMRAFCLLTYEAVCRAVETQNSYTAHRKNTPSLIILDYEMERDKDFAALSLIKTQQALAGVPLFFMADRRDESQDEICYGKGAMVVLKKPFSDAEVLRIERMAWQYEVTRNYEKMLQKQAGDLQAAREIHRLNDELQSKNQLLHQIFGRYFSDEVVDVILDHPEGAAIGGEKREVTIMMSDLRGFTSASEKMSPEATTDLLNFYFGQMLEVITLYHGTVIEFLGDGILAVFGAPLALESQCSDAVAAAICMQNRMRQVNAYCGRHGYPPLEMGIGVHQGEVFVGNVGSEKMMRYNVIGQAVNQCSRIESFSVGGQVLVSKETLCKIPSKVDVRSHIEIAAKGISKPIPVYEVLRIEGDYQCALEDVAPDVLVSVQEPVIFNLYPIEGKMVLDHALVATLQQFSRKRAIVKIEHESGGILTEFSDVEIFAAGQNGHALFTNVYAKLVKIEGDVLTLHFTHENKAFRIFAKHVLGEE